MEILCYRDSAGNFGDDLNAFLWRESLPAQVFDIPDIVLIGIGSIFNAYCAPLSETRGKRVFVLGSGAGYGPLPPDWESWNLLALRGPLTADLVERPDLAITDSAALLSLLPSINSAPRLREAVLFMPHYNSVPGGQWECVAAQAGMTFVDPRWPVPKVLEHFLRAKLVITEAMHGAIVADSLRIPWIPVSIAPDTLSFKWWDWALSLGMVYEPVRLPSSSLHKSLYHRLLIRQAKRNAVAAPAFVSSSNASALIADFKTRYKASAPESPRLANGSKPQNHVRSLVHSALRTFDGFFVDNAVKHLRNIALEKTYLSCDDVFQDKVEQLQTAAATFVKLIRD
jgi:succinoglycan biosynthesis protein ExoV